MYFRMLLLISFLLSCFGTRIYTMDIRFEPIPAKLPPAMRDVVQIAQDKLGFIWLASRGGLIRYDGYNHAIYRFSPDDPRSISSNFINYICSGASGNIWVGTIDGGLNKYDPATDTFTRYRHDPKDPGSIANNLVLSLLEDRSGDLWIGTPDGLSWLPADRQTAQSDSGAFLNFKPREMLQGSDMLDQIWSIYEDADQDIWMGTLQGDILRFDRQSRQFIREIKEGRPTLELGFNSYKSWNSQMEGPVVSIQSFASDGDSIITIACRRYIYKYHIRNNQIINFCPRLNQEFVPSIRKKIFLSGRLISSILIDRQENVWVATDNGGFLQPPGNAPYRFFTTDPSDPTSLSSSFINNLFEDKNGLIWIALNGANGVHTFDPIFNKIDFYPIQLDGQVNIGAIYSDPAQGGRILWLGVHLRGLVRYDRWLKQGRLYPTEINRQISFIKPEMGNPSVLWIGTIGSGLYRFDINSETFTQHVYRNNEDSRDPGRPIQGTGFAMSMIFEAPGRAWLASLRGVYLFDLETNEYLAFQNETGNAKTLRANTVSTLNPAKQYGKNYVWVGTRNGGLHLFNTEKGEFEHFTFYYSDGQKEADIPYICYVMESRTGDVWVATPQGVFCRRYGKEKFCQVMDPDKKLAEEIYAVHEDNLGRIWLYSRAGIYMYHPQNGQIIGYEGETSRYAYHQNEQGELFYARGSAVMAFQPDSIQLLHDATPVVLTDFQIFYKSVKPDSGGHSPINIAIPLAKEIELSHEQSVFSFEFAALNYVNPVKNRYAFQMSEVDPDWIFTDATRRFATYTNLDPGNYIFRVKGTDGQGIWNDTPTVIRVRIHPPWWATYWAYLFYAFATFLLLFFLRRYDLYRQRLKQALALEHAHAQNLEEVDRLRSRFFTNITHEFRTPLTLIQGPVQQLIDGQFQGNLKEQYRLILRNSRRLLKLINQILELAKLDAGHIHLQVSKTELVTLIKAIIGTFSTLAETRNITMKLKSKEKSLHGFVDYDKTEKILTNLLSNAFKFTPDGGHILVLLEVGETQTEIKSPVKQSKKWLEGKNTRSFPPSNYPPGWNRKRGVTLKVINSGPGIAPDQIARIFDRFYRVDESDRQSSVGTGVGLALIKELVILCRGEISVQSIPGKETCFCLWLPFEYDAYYPTEFVSSPAPVAKDIQIEAPEAKSAGESVAVNREKQCVRKGLPRLLLIEDNPDVAGYITGILQDHYRMVTAQNGLKGYKETIERFPDLVISDVIMPEMDGFAYCQKVKSDQRTCHIPVILLTARGDVESKITGLELGADAYLGKPFDAAELKAQIENLLMQRQRLRSHFQENLQVPQAGDLICANDQKFYKRVTDLIDENLGDVSFNVEKLASEVGMSRTHLTRKLAALTGQSTVDLMRRIRLHKAVSLLKEKGGNVGEIAWQVGFENPSYFTKCFRREFGMNPTAHLKLKKQIDEIPRV